MGNNPHPITDLRGANVGSRYAVPLRIKPERGQVSENSSKPSTKERCHVLHDDVAGNVAGHRTGAVFRTDDGSPYADTGRQFGGQIKTGFRSALMRAQLREVTPHDLRHTWATWFYALTKDPLLLKAEGGWATLAMVERYAHLMPSGLAGEIRSVWGASHPRIGALPGAVALRSVHAESA